MAAELLTPERDADSLSDQLETSADHPDTCKSMVHEARRVIERNFDQARLDDVLADMMMEIAAHDPRTSARKLSRGISS